MFYLLNFFSLKILTNSHTIAQTNRLCDNKMSDNGEQYNTWFTTNLHGKGFNKGNPITVKPVDKINTGFVFRVHTPDRYSKSGWVCATTLDVEGFQFYQMVNGKRVALATRIHRICGDTIQSHHSPYNLDAGKSVNKNEIIEYFKNQSCTGFFVTAKLSNGSLVLVCN